MGVCLCDVIYCLSRVVCVAESVKLRTCAVLIRLVPGGVPAKTTSKSTWRKGNAVKKPRCTQNCTRYLTQSGSLITFTTSPLTRPPTSTQIAISCCCTFSTSFEKGRWSYRRQCCGEIPQPGAVSQRDDSDSFASPRLTSTVCFVSTRMCTRML
jgi:hypothetical protein